MRSRESERLLYRYYSIGVAVEHQSRLLHVWERRVATGISKESIGKRHFAAFTVMKDRHHPASLPSGRALRTQLGKPKPVETESRSEQHRPLDIRMARSIKRRQITTQARTDQNAWLVCYLLLDQVKLAANRDVLEIAFGQVENLQLSSACRQFTRKKLSFLGTRTRSETVQV